MLNYIRGKPIAEIIDKQCECDRKILYISTEEEKVEDDSYDSFSEHSDDSVLNEEFKEIELNEGFQIKPLISQNEREVVYVAGPSGSGKSFTASMLINDFHEIYPDSEIFFFSRTDYEDDPVYNGLNMNQIKIDEDIVTDPIDITEQCIENSLVVFDDVTTIPDNKIREAVEKLMADIMEIGRKLKIWIIITSHLVLGNEKKMSRTIMNELQSMYVFPKSGSSQQISYALKTYFGFDKKQIDRILHLDSRWIKISKGYPQYILYDKGAYIL